MSALTVAALAVGFVLLIGGGEVLVRGAGGLAATLGISPLVVGLTVVAFATSAPDTRGWPSATWWAATSRTSCSSWG
jgi:cation:H+ antiporter